MLGCWWRKYPSCNLDSWVQKCKRKLPFMVLLGIHHQHCLPCCCCPTVPCRWTQVLGHWKTRRLCCWPTRMCCPCLVHHGSRLEIQRSRKRLLRRLRSCWNSWRWPGPIPLGSGTSHQPLLCCCHVVPHWSLCLRLLRRTLHCCRWKPGLNKYRSLFE